MKIETDKEKILEERLNCEGPWCEVIDLGNTLNSMLDEAYIKGYSDALVQIGLNLLE